MSHHRFIQAEQATYPIAVLCRARRVARLMLVAGLVGYHRRRRVRMTVADPAATLPPGVPRPP